MPRKTVELGLIPIYVLLTTIPVAAGALLALIQLRRRPLSRAFGHTLQNVDAVRWTINELNEILLDVQNDMSTVGQELLRNRNLLEARFSAVKTDLENTNALTRRTIDTRLVEIVKLFEATRNHAPAPEHISAQHASLVNQVGSIKTQLDTIATEISRSNSENSESASKQIRNRMGEIKAAFTLAIDDLILQQDQKFDAIAKDIQTVKGAMSELASSVPANAAGTSATDPEKIQKAIEASIQAAIEKSFGASIDAAIQSATSQVAELVKSVAQSNIALSETVTGLPNKIDEYISNITPIITADIHETSRRSDAIILDAIKRGISEAEATGAKHFSEFEKIASAIQDANKQFGVQILDDIKRVATDNVSANAQHVIAYEKLATQIQDASRRSDTHILEIIKRGISEAEATGAKHFSEFEKIASAIQDANKQFGVQILDDIKRVATDNVSANAQHVIAYEKLATQIQDASRRSDAHILEIINRGIADSEAANVKHALEFKKIADDIYESSRRFDTHILEAIKRSASENEAANIRRTVAVEKIAADLQDALKRSDGLILDAIKNGVSESEAASAQHATAFHKAAKAVAELERSIASGFQKYTKSVEALTSQLPNAIRSQIEIALTEKIEDQIGKVSLDLKGALSLLKDKQQSELLNFNAKLDQSLRVIERTVTGIATKARREPTEAATLGNTLELNLKPVETTRETALERLDAAVARRKKNSDTASQITGRTKSSASQRKNADRARKK